MWNSVNIHKIQISSMFESADGLVAESHSRDEVTVIDFEGGGGGGGLQ